MTVNYTSMNSTTNVYATSAANWNSTSATQQQNQATMGVSINTMDEFLANVGQSLGLSPAQIDAGQAIMHAAFGDYAGAAQNCLEAANNLLTQQSPIDQGYIANTRSNLAESGSQTALQTIQNANAQQQSTDETSGTKGKAKNFFEAMAMALGKMMGEKMADMYKSLQELEKAGGPTTGTGLTTAATGGSGTSSSAADNSSTATTGTTGTTATTGTTGTTGNTGNNSNSGATDQTTGQTTTKDAAEEQKARDFGIAQSKFSADAQMFSMISNLVNTTIKTVGEALSTVARKG